VECAGDGGAWPLRGDTVRLAGPLPPVCRSIADGIFGGGGAPLALDCGVPPTGGVLPPGGGMPDLPVPDIIDLGVAGPGDGGPGMPGIGGILPWRVGGPGGPLKPPPAAMAAAEKFGAAFGAGDATGRLPMRGGPGAEPSFGKKFGRGGGAVVTPGPFGTGGAATACFQVLGGGAT